MVYLTYDEYETFGFTDVTEDEFNKLLPRSTALLDYVTSHFYAKNDVEKDNTWRVDKFKRALGAQIEYFQILGATTFEQINSSPQSFSAGRTSVSNSSRYNPGGDNESKSLIAEEVFIYLSGTGLLYAGVGTW